MSKSAPATEKDRFESLAERLEKMEGQVDIVRGQSKSMGSTLAFYEEDDSPALTPSQMKALRKANAQRGRSLQQYQGLVQAGYDSQFKSVSTTEFLQGVASLRRPNSEEAREFMTRYEGSKKSLLETLTSGLPESQKKAIGLNTFDGDTAGSLVLPEFAPTIMEKSYGNDLWGRTDNYTVGGNTMTFPKSKDEDRRDGQRSGGLGHHWVGEEKEIKAFRPGVDDFSLKLKKLAIVVFVTEELLSDASYALTQWVSRKVREELDFALGNATVRGTGVLQPTGYLGHSSSVVVDAEGSQGANTVTGKNILDMYARRIAGATSSYAWYMNQDVQAQLPGLVLGGGEAAQLVYQPPGMLSSAPNGSLMGLPIVPTEFNSSIGNVGDIALCDYSKMVTIGKGGVTEDVSTHVEFLRDQVAYKFTIRVDGRPCDDEPVTPFQGTNTQSAFITLAARV